MRKDPTVWGQKKSGGFFNFAEFVKALKVNLSINY
jgi:hypothetical protein